MTDTPNIDMQDVRDRFRVLFRFVFIVGFILIVLSALTGIGITIGLAQSDVPLAYIHIVTRMLHVSLGLIIGFFFVFLGLIACWMGLEAQVKMKGELNTASLSLATASPGIVLMICGTVLIAICLLKTSSVQERDVDGRVRQTVGSPPTG